MSKKLLAAIAAILMLLLCAQALAQETTPMAVKVQEGPVLGERIDVFKRDRSYRGIEASNKWLYQARLGRMSLDMRMFTFAGEQLLFQECLGTDGRGGVRLSLRAGVEDETVLLQMDQKAVDVLERLGVTEIVVTNEDMYVQAMYLVSDLAALREAFALGEREQLCVSGLDNPVTVVSVDGVRRQITE